MSTPDLVQVVNAYGAAKVLHLATPASVPEGEPVYIAPVGHDRALTLVRARQEHAGAPACSRCWATLPSAVQVRLIGPPDRVEATLSVLQSAATVVVGQPIDADQPGHQILYTVALGANADLLTALWELERAVTAERQTLSSPTATGQRRDAAAKRVARALDRIDELAGDDAGGDEGDGDGQGGGAAR